MSRPQAISLRVPAGPAQAGQLLTCELSGGWMYGGRGLRDALVELSKPAALAQLASRGGSGAPWAPGRDLEAAAWTARGWPQDGMLARAEWEGKSIEGMEQGWGAERGALREPDWREGGWLWSPEHGCWMMPTYVLGFAKGGVRGHFVEAMRLQPAALTFWQWDNDPLNETHLRSLSGDDLELMAQGMMPCALDLLIAGLSGPYEAPALNRARLEAMRDRALLEEETPQASTDEGGAKRL